MNLRKASFGNAARVIGAVIMLGVLVSMPTNSYSEDAKPAGAMTPPPPMMDSTLMSWVGEWAGDVKMGDMAIYGEATFSPAVGHQWIEATIHMWPDKTKKTAAMMEFTFFVRPGETPHTYKAAGMGNDGSLGTATVAPAGGNLVWNWTYDNGTKELGTLTVMGADHFSYKGVMSDKAGTKLMEFQQDMIRTKK